MKATSTTEDMNLNSHPHPYGIMIGGNDLGPLSKAICTARPTATGTSLCAGSARMRFR